MWQYSLSAGIAFAMSLVMTFVVRTLARRFNFVAKPRADRWHRKPTALFGGVGIFAGFVCAYLWHRPADLQGNVLLVLCASGMFAVGFLDDLVQLKPYAKLIGQTICSAVLTTFGLRLHWLPAPVLDQALTIFWLVGITNALNLLDNLDGAAAGVAAIAAAYLVYFCDAAGQHSAAMLAATFCGAVSGFLVLNINPATIFMGDCGSLFIGFFLGGVALVGNQPGLRRNMLAILTIPVLVLLLPIIDTALVTVSRKLHGRAVSKGGRDHASHRLVALGLSERGAALTLWLLSAASGAVAVMVRQTTWMIATLVLPLFAMVVMFFLVFVGRVRVYEPVTNEQEGRGRALLPTLADFSYKRHVLEVLSDLVVIVLAYDAAYLLRFEGQIVQPFYDRFVLSLPLVIGTQLAALLAAGLYRGMWRYTSVSDISTLLRAILGAWIAAGLAILLVFRFEGFSRGMVVMDGVLLLVGIGGTRVSFRLVHNWLLRLRAPANVKRVLIYGAGDGGELLVRELQNNGNLGLHPVGFLDDDPQKVGRVIHGVRVLGSIERLSDLARAKNVEELVISTARLTTRRSELVEQFCAVAGVSCRRMRIALDEAGPAPLERRVP